MTKRSKTRAYLRRLGINPDDLPCINPDDVPCPDARKSLKKKGMLCKVTPKKPAAHTPKPKKSHKKGFFERWFG